MIKGLFYSPKRDFAVLRHLLVGLDVSVVTGLAALARKSKLTEISFVYLVDPQEAWDVAAKLATLRPDLPIICACTEALLPSIRSLYAVKTNHDPVAIANAAAFHRAQLKGEILATFPTTGRDPFFIANVAPTGIMLADADDYVFYLNPVARELVGNRAGIHLVSTYFDLRQNVVQRFEDDDNQSRRVSTNYDSVKARHTARPLSVSRQDIEIQGQRMGTAYYIEDADRRLDNVRRLTNERRRFEHLANRLNEVLLKDMASHAYQASYLKRKIDLEIRRAKRSPSQVSVVSLKLDGLDHVPVPAAKIKKLVSAINEMLLIEYPEPNVLGILEDGHWIAVCPGEVSDFSKGASWIAAPVTQMVENYLPGTCIIPVVKEENNLAKYQDVDELIAVLGRL
jgi:hypothetical protein